MAATDSGKYSAIRVLPSSEGVIGTTAKEPDATASLTNFRGSNANLAGAGAIAIQINGTEYVIPVLTNA